MEIFNKCNAVSTPESLSEFLNLLAEDCKNNIDEWENTTIPEFLEAIAGFIDDNNSPSSLDPINWNTKKAHDIAKLFYMGKIYE